MQCLITRGEAGRFQASKDQWGWFNRHLFNNSYSCDTIAHLSPFKHLSERKFTYNTVHKFEVYNYVASDMFTDICSRHHNFRTSPQKESGPFSFHCPSPSSSSQAPLVLAGPTFFRFPYFFRCGLCQFAVVGSCDWNSLNFRVNSQFSFSPYKVFVSLVVQAAAAANTRAHHFALCGCSYGSFTQNCSFTA